VVEVLELLSMVFAGVQALEVVVEGPLYQLKEKLVVQGGIFAFVARRGLLLLDASPLQPVEAVPLLTLVPWLAQLPTLFALFAVCPSLVALARSEQVLPLRLMVICDRAMS
jgi:hypothetical protein